MCLDGNGLRILGCKEFSKRKLEGLACVWGSFNGGRYFKRAVWVLSYGWETLMFAIFCETTIYYRQRSGQRETKVVGWKIMSNQDERFFLYTADRIPNINTP